MIVLNSSLKLKFASAARLVCAGIAAGAGAVLLDQLRLMSDSNTLEHVGFMAAATLACGASAAATVYCDSYCCDCKLKKLDL